MSGHATNVFAKGDRYGVTILPKQAAALVIAMSFLVVACSFVNPPPAGTFAVQAKVTNETAEDVPIVIATPTGGLPGAAQATPAIARSTTNVTLHIPAVGDRILFFGPTDRSWEGGYTRERIGDMLEQGCSLDVEIGSDGNSVGCAEEP